MRYFYFWSPAYGWGWLFVIVFWVLVVLIIVAIIRAIAGSGYYRNYRNEESGNTALQILNERYARGEIAREEYEAKKRDISG